ncbi:unnamed protein product [Protopolystoma xenopodis]|uniref:Uncharacterized protein n=1 Tax=Protopolystoma xenopodis TaxID=117903 RepID=A0A448X569_9PLAT|nr:unnamed protein product [Protopolystoma xenopodis]
MLAPDVLQYISLTCLVNRYLLIGLASLTAGLDANGFIASSSSGLNSSQPPTGSTTTCSGSAAAPGSAITLNPGLANLQEAVSRLQAIVICLPSDWRYKRESARDPTDDSTGSLEIGTLSNDNGAHSESNSPPVENGLAQMKRFTGQLLERCKSISRQLLELSTKGNAEAATAGLVLRWVTGMRWHPVNALKSLYCLLVSLKIWNETPMLHCVNNMQVMI